MPEGPAAGLSIIACRSAQIPLRAPRIRVRARSVAKNRSIILSVDAGFIVVIAIGWAYHAILESSSWQATLGKRALGMQVTNLAGNRISIGRAAGRHAAG